MAWNEYYDYNSMGEDRDVEDEDQYFDNCTEVTTPSTKAVLIERPHRSDPQMIYQAWIPNSACTWSPKSGELALRHWFTADWKVVSNAIQGEEDVIIDHPGKPVEEPPF